MRNETQHNDWYSWVSLLNPTYNFKAAIPPRPYALTKRFLPNAQRSSQQSAVSSQL
ncbi:MAG: hypothetical protein F6J93_35450 [Oscillatoria sp. SIO1A7]|nr:hypothetical protein [Oscillatoria sp. SIO1A7]